MGTLRMLRALRWKAHAEALAEVITVTIISILPLILGGLIRWLQIENSALSFNSYKTYLSGLLVHGELFLYALAFIAVIAWTALREWPLGLRPPRLLLGLFCIISIAIITIFFSLDTAKVSLHIEAVLKGSELMFVITLVFYYLATVLSKIDPPDIAAVLSESSNNLASQLEKQ